MTTLRRMIPAIFLLTLLLAQRLAAAPTHQSPPAIGAVTAVAVDAQGNGWAVAAPQGSGELSAFLLRIENGAWSVAADSSDTNLFFEDLYIHKLVLTADGQHGWAIGQDVHLQEPVLWRLQNGTWSRVPVDLPPNARKISDIAINADSTDGWLTVHNPEHNAEYLMRLINGSWVRAELPEGVGLEFVSIGTSATVGWATGYLNGEPKVFGLSYSDWIFVPGAFLPPGSYLSAVAADNQGNGWVAALQGPPTSKIYLIRLSGSSPPGVALELSRPAGQEANSEIKVDLSALAVDWSGRGYAAGSFQLAVTGATPLSYSYHTAIARLDGDTATEVPAWSPGPISPNMRPRALAISYDGGRGWLGGGSEKLEGILTQVREPWSHETPAAAQPIDGQALCFREVPYCLRGIFEHYWRNNGGLERFGYPITPEITENIGGTDYRVQYTQRARFEDHPEYDGTPHRVLLGLLGNTLADPRQSEAAFAPQQPTTCPDCLYFPETGHTIAPPFVNLWQNNDGLRIYGLPRSEAFEEKSLTDGKTYLVQYFERNRIEHHPEHAGTSAEFLLGLLGVEQFEKTYGFIP